MIPGVRTPMTGTRESYAAGAPVRQMWRETPVREIAAANGHRAWLVTGMAEARAVLSDPRFSRAEVRRLGVSTADAAIFEQEGILDQDPPEHTRLRRLVAAAF